MDTFVKVKSKKERLDEKVLSMIVEDNQPFSCVNQKGFRDLMKEVDPDYALPDRKTLTARFNKDYSEKIDQVCAVYYYYSCTNH